MLDYILSSDSTFQNLSILIDIDGIIAQTDSTENNSFQKIHPGARHLTIFALPLYPKQPSLPPIPSSFASCSIPIYGTAVFVIQSL